MVLNPEDVYGGGSNVQGKKIRRSDQALPQSWAEHYIANAILRQLNMHILAGERLGEAINLIRQLVGARLERRRSWEAQPLAEEGQSFPDDLYLMEYKDIAENGLKEQDAPTVKTARERGIEPRLLIRTAEFLSYWMVAPDPATPITPRRPEGDAPATTPPAP